MAIEQLDIPRLKQTLPVRSNRGTLTLGDNKNQNFHGTLTIDVERYPCTMIAKPPTASSFVVKTDLSGAPGASTQSSTTVVGNDQQPGGDLAAIRNQRVYQVENVDEPGTKMNVEMDELERGFEYGRTAVHISESDSNIVKIETQPGLELIGFVQEEKVQYPFSSSISLNIQV